MDSVLILFLAKFNMILPLILDFFGSVVFAPYKIILGKNILERSLFKTLAAYRLLEGMDCSNKRWTGSFCQ